MAFERLIKKLCFGLSLSDVCEVWYKVSLLADDCLYASGALITYGNSIDYLLSLRVSFSMNLNSLKELSIDSSSYPKLLSCCSYWLKLMLASNDSSISSKQLSIMLPKTASGI